MAIVDPHIPGFQAVVLRNGDPIRFSEAIFTRDNEHLMPGWSVNLPQPVLLDPDDTWTIKLGFAGALRTLVNEVTAEKFDSNDAVKSYARSISGTGDGNPETAALNDYLEYCIPKTYVFVRSDWLQQVGPWASLKDGIIQGKNFDGTYFRFMHARLPKQEIKDAEFECFVGSWTHQSIARHLAQMVGLDLICNLPDIPVIDTCTIPVGTTWFAAIKTNLEIWRPYIQMEATDSRARITFTDILAGEADIPGLQKMTLSRKAIASVSTTEDNPGGGKNKVDHVIVTGRESPNSLLVIEDDGDGSIVEIPEAFYPVTKTVGPYKVSVDTSRVSQWQQFDNYTGAFGEDDDEFTPRGVKYTMHTEKRHIDRRKQLDLLIEETDETTRQDGKLCHKVVKEFRYGPDGQPIGSKETEAGLVRWPGQSEEQWKTFKVHHILQNQFHAGIKKALTSEFTEELVLYTTNTVLKKLAPIPLSRYLKVDFDRTAIEKDTETTQAVLEMWTRQRWNKIDRKDDKTLEQKIFDWDLLQGHGTIQRQTLQNPEKTANKKDLDPTIYRKEIHDGAGVYISGAGPCYHPPVTVGHEDIDNDTTAEALADRIFAAANQRKVNVTVTTHVPIPLETLAFRVTLPEISYAVDDETVTVPSGDYILKGFSHRFGYAGEAGRAKLNHELTMNVWKKAAA